jgi:hypothetical protein
MLVQKLRQLKLIVSIVGFLHRSDIAARKFHELQRQSSKTERELPTDIEERWFSTLHLWRVELEYRQEETCVLLDPDLGRRSRAILPEPLFINEWRLIESLIKLLGPLEDASIALSADEKPTISQLFPLLQHKITITDACEVCNTANSFKEQLISQLKTRFADIVEKPVCLLATFLDPRFKTFLFSTKQNQIVKELLDETIRRTAAGPGSADSESESSDYDRSDHFSSPPRKIPRFKLSYGFGNDRVINEVVNSNELSDSRESHEAIESHSLLHQITKKLKKAEGVSVKKSEFERYVEEGLVENDNILTYWLEKKTVFPQLASLVRKYLCIQASNTSSERLGSTSSRTITKTRCSLTGRRAGQLIKLKRNMHLLK